MKIIQTIRQNKKIRKAIDLYGDSYEAVRDNLEELFQYYREKQMTNIAVWGAGLKGEAFLKVIDSQRTKIKCVFDIDEEKYGTYMNSGHEIVDYKKRENQNIQVILLMNNTYENETIALLREKDFYAEVVNIDSFVDGNLNVQEFLEMQANKELIKRSTVCGKVATVTILYNFNRNCIQNITSYSNETEAVFAYDNSTLKNQTFIEELKKIPNVIYVDGNGNQGLAKPINQIAEKAMMMGYEWLITFDQDSVAEKGMLKKMIGYAESCKDTSKIGIICPAVSKKVVKFEKAYSKISYNKWIQQSGAMHNLKVLEKVGNYDEKLFIDQVDYEYCVRILSKGYKIVKVNDAILYHNVEDDNTQFIRKHGRPLYVNKYSSKRYYYCVRNILYCTEKYKKINKQYYESQRRNLGSLLRTFPYDQQKLKKIRAILWGWIDYKIEKMGKTNRVFGDREEGMIKT